MSLPRHLVLSAIAASALVVCGGEQALAGDTKPAALETRVPALITQLGSVHYAIRTKAQADLLALASVDRKLVLTRALDAYLKSVDLEVRVRLRSAMFGIVAGELPSEGFLGIRMMDAPIRVLRGREVVQIRAVQVLTVIAGTAASEAGLLPGDRIRELDGNAFDGKTLPYMALSEYIRGKTSGEAIELAITRGTEDLTIKLELGARPDILDEGRRERAFEEWLDKSLGRHQPATEKPAPAPPLSKPDFPAIPIPRQPLAPFPFPDGKP